MLISEKNLREVCNFLVQEYQNGRSTKPDSLKSFRGLSLLLVGYKEKSIIDDSINQIYKIADRQKVAANG